MDRGVEEEKLRLAGGVELPASLDTPQKIDNPKKKESDSLSEWRKIEFDGVAGRITSEKLSVEVDGVRATIRVLVADFREEGDEEQNVVISFTGFPGLNEGLRSEYLRGEFDKPASQASLGLASFEKAAQSRGLLFIPELQTLPVDKRKKKQSFLTDAVVIRRGIEETMARRSADRPMKSLAESEELSLSGYSNGAGEAGAFAAVLSEEMKDKAGRINLRLYSLVGIVPVPDIATSFGKEVWAITLVELAQRYEKLFGVKHDPNTREGQRELLAGVGKMLTTAEGRGKFWGEVKKSLKGGQEGGNLQIGIDLIKKVQKDVAGLIPHLGKYENVEYPSGWGKNVDLELVVPRFDRIFWSLLEETSFEVARKMGCAEQLMGAVAAVPEYYQKMPVIPGRWWRGLFPNIGSFKMAVVGEKLGEPLSTHTGVVGGSRKFAKAVLAEY